MDHYRNNLELLKLIRSGDKAARHELVEANIGLVYACAKKLMKTAPAVGGCWAADARRQQYEELVERGYHGLCEGAAHVETIKHSRVGPYLWSWIHGAMVRPDQELIENLPPDVKVWQQLNGELDNRADNGWAFREMDPARIFWNEWDRADALLLIFWCCEDTADLQIVKRRLDGQGFGAVARSLGTTPQAVGKRLRRIEVDFRRLHRRGRSYQ
jgi:hypothetical protein